MSKKNEANLENEMKLGILRGFQEFERIFKNFSSFEKNVRNFQQELYQPTWRKRIKKFEKEPYKWILDNLDVKLINELSRLSLKLSDLQANG
jgi:hypothetical protein